MRCNMQIPAVPTNINRSVPSIIQNICIYNKIRINPNFLSMLYLKKKGPNTLPGETSRDGLKFRNQFSFALLIFAKENRITNLHIDTDRHFFLFWLAE